jgi:gamma-glutamyltranspeptidase/glutathione hydrolase
LPDGGVLACGTPGGDQQDQWTLLFLLRYLSGRTRIQESIDAPNWHTTHFPSSFFPHDAHPGEVHVEERVGGDVIGALRRRGHRVQRRGGWELGRVHAVEIRDHVLRAGANQRGLIGYAAGR